MSVARGFSSIKMMIRLDMFMKSHKIWNIVTKGQSSCK